MENNKLIKHEAGLLKQVGNAINITNKLLLPNLRPLKILHLDDHLIFSKGVSNCIYKKFPNATINFVQDGDKALEYVSHCLKNNELLDLIITDIIHPGLDGIEFSKAVREKEKNNECKIPILFITMLDDKSMVRKAEEIPFTKYLLVSAPCEVINYAINSII